MSDELETVKQLLLAVASRAEATDARLDRYIEAAEERGRLLDERLDRLSQDVANLSATVRTQSEEAERDRALFQAETRQIWEYLMARYQNGRDS